MSLQPFRIAAQVDLASRDRRADYKDLAIETLADSGSGTPRTRRGARSGRRRAPHRIARRHPRLAPRHGANATGSAHASGHSSTHSGTSMSSNGNVHVSEMDSLADRRPHGHSYRARTDASDVRGARVGEGAVQPARRRAHPSGPSWRLLSVDGHALARKPIGATSAPRPMGSSSTRSIAIPRTDSCRSPRRAGRSMT
jgi:hypothetical protein